MDRRLVAPLEDQRLVGLRLVVPLEDQHLVDRLLVDL